ncbi:MAG: putative toxin-antitoxin system toxin component, PIN family [Solirubrobacteraceae bacterium]
MRAVLDPNVLVSALLSPRGTPGGIIRAWNDGRFDLVVSAALLDELGRVLAYPKLRKRVSEDESRRYLDRLARDGEVTVDPAEPPKLRSDDPDDDYLIALAEQSRAAIVSGDKHLLVLADRIPVFSPRDWLDRIPG